jgi:O-acetyl-ADP-ribose deacetylase (regulator of RNase III)
MREIDGNLLDYFDNKEFDMIAHQANCFHTFGSGIAREIKERYPEAYQADLSTPKNDIMKLGTYSHCTLPQGLILNIYGQYEMSSKFIATNYDALGVAFYKINHLFSGMHIGLPLIGCGIAGGEWRYVRYLIEARFKDMKVTIVHFK